MTAQDDYLNTLNPEYRWVAKPWGAEAVFAANSTYAGKILHIADGHRLSKQFHRLKDETLVVLRGFLELELEDKTLNLEPGQSVKIDSGTTHRLKASRGNCEVVEFSSPELRDVVRLEDDYGRAGTEETPLG